MQFAQHERGHLERTPDPVRAGIVLLDPYLDYAFSIHGDRVEELRLLDREQQERQTIVGQRSKSVDREPDRIGQADGDRFVTPEQRQRAEDRVAQSGGLGLYGVDDVGVAITRSEVFKDVRLAGAD